MGKEGHHSEPITFYLANLGQEDLILGTDWLRLHNPDVNWQTDQIMLSRCPKTCFSHPTLMIQGISTHQMSMEFTEEEEETEDLQWIPEGMHAFKTTIATKLAQDAPKRTGINLVPKRVSVVCQSIRLNHHLGDSKARPWDHAIDLKPDAKALCGEKAYSLDNKPEGKHPGCSFPRTWTKVTFNPPLLLGGSCYEVDTLSFSLFLSFTIHFHILHLRGPFATL